jgi:acyl-CoA synthetase (AMP-forming)/AMP-acid ligase II
MPGGLPGSVGDLLVEGLARMGAIGIVHGPVQDSEDAIDEILAHRVECLVGIPVQVLSLVRHPKRARIPRGFIRSVLLSTDYVPASIVADIEQTWGCRVYQHYGMTEMGYGGGVECDAHDGYHLREADLFVEIADPATGRPLPDGICGEVVVTTFTRRAMPLVRFQAALIPVNGFSRLSLTVHCDPCRFPDTLADVRAALARVPAVRDAVARGLLDIMPIRLSPENWFTTGAAKRTLIDRRQEAKSS